MSDTPLQVLTRPFAIEPVTNIMLPDGIFDNAIYGLRIAAHVTNMSGSALNNVTVYLESVGDPGIVPVARTFFFASIPAGAAMLVMWDADFQHATPGKRLVSFVAKADGYTPHRSIQQIFVSQTRASTASPIPTRARSKKAPWKCPSRKATCRASAGAARGRMEKSAAARPAWGRSCRPA